MRKSALVLAIYVFVAVGAWFGQSVIHSTSAQGFDTPKKLVFAIDGFSVEAFKTLRSRGYFKQFNHFGAHIAPYPSITEPSWTEITGAKEAFGNQANVKSIEAKYFDREASSVVDDPRLVFSRAAHPLSFFRAFNYYYNPFLETLMYFPEDSIIQMELDEVEASVLNNFTGEHFIAYIVSSDSIAHTQKDKLLPLLIKISDLIDRVQEHYKKAGTPLEIYLVSDHGNVGRFHEGEPEVPLKSVSLDSIARAAGLRITEHLEGPKDIAIPVMALASMATVYFKDLSMRRAFAQAAVQTEGIELTSWLEVTPEGQKIVIIGEKGQEAELYWSDAGYAYLPVNGGNPLQLDPRLHSASKSQLNWISDREMFEATAASQFPDAPFRLVQGAKKQVDNEPDLFLDIKDGYRTDGPLGEFVTMIRTHGALSARSTLGIFASTEANIPAYTRSRDIFKVIGIKPQELFHETADLAHVSPVHAVEKARRTAKTGIPTRLSDLSSDVLYRRLTKMLSLTTELIDSRDMRDIGKAVAFFAKTSASGSAPATQEQVTKIMKAFNFREVLNHVDDFTALKGALASEKDPDKIDQVIENRLVATPGLEPLKGILEQARAGTGRSKEEDSALLTQGLDAFRRVVMKLYTVPYFINELLNLPESDVTPDPRDLDFAEKWATSLRGQVRREPETLFADPGLAQKLFDSVFQERRAFHDLYPATFPLVYNPSPKEVTIVFVPGIYNELFDREIFERGLHSLTEQLNLRVIYADVDGRCGSSKNAQAILELMKTDTRERLARGYHLPHYLILGYSKGGVDSTEALLLDPDFVRKQVLGLVAIASPLQGTSVIESTDLPSQITENAVIRPLPGACKSDTASKSLNRAARANFWSRNLSKLAGLTRYYSVSFASDMKDAHPWMKISKVLAKFNSPNDGVVPVASSKFPEALRAIDLGTLNADHLAGIQASSFPQEAFLEAVEISLQELGAFERLPLIRWYERVSTKSPILLASFHKRELSQTALQALELSHSGLIPYVGPLPDAERALEGDSDSMEWYDVIAKTENLASLPLQCGSAPRAQTRSFIKALNKSTRNGVYALKPFDIECLAHGKVLLKIPTRPGSLFKFWETIPVKSIEVKTLGELVQALLSEGLLSGENLLESGNSLALIPKSNRPPLQLPQNSLGWSEDRVLDLREMPGWLASSKVTPITPANAPKDGINIIFDHQSMKDFRREYQFSYESRSPGGIDDNPAGYLPVVEQNGDQQEVALRMRSKANSIRLTTAAIRFKPADFRNFELKLKVTQGVVGADPAKGGSGKDDSAFQLWFTLRNSKSVADRSQADAKGEAKLFGYYWADPNTSGQMPAPGSIIENTYSRKNFLVVTLPESYQLVLDGGKSAGPHWFDFRRDFLNDLKRAFPNEPVEDWEVVSMTLQTDSDDSKSSSECFLKKIAFEP